MGTMILGECKTCRYSVEIADSYLAVVLDQEVEETVTQHAHPEFPRVLILGHPLESRILNEFGFTFFTAATQGRLLRVSNRICPACGTLYERRSIVLPQFILGCVPSLLVFVLLGVTLWVYSHDAAMAFFLASFAAMLTMVIIDGIGHALLHRKKRHLRFTEYTRLDTCPSCAHIHGLPPGNAKQHFPCPLCKEKTMTYRIHGIS